MPLINWKSKLSLKWIKNYVLTTADNSSKATFKTPDIKLDVPFVTLLAEDNEKLANQLSEGFKRSVHWNKYKVIERKLVEITDANAEKHIRKLFNLSYQGVKRSFVFIYDNTV